MLSKLADNSSNASAAANRCLLSVVTAALGLFAVGRLTALTVNPPSQTSARFDVLHAFGPAVTGPVRPSILIRGTDGNLYGASERVTDSSRATIFKMTT